ncbi:MAG: radical SAM protein [Gemmatales bacterium]|nr:radical SAM protein [Gemmatales bacterium]MDW8223936.1 radical SAM protein [Gemmatales bacterium]
MSATRPILDLFRDHRRSFEDNHYVYAVISRRSRGLSVGINLNPDKACNFDCVYCQVDRRNPPQIREVDLTRLRLELEEMIGLARSGAVFELPRFRHTPVHLRRWNDLAISGDGEPTAAREFLEAVRLIVEVKRKHQLDGIPILLLTNATLLHRPQVQQALSLLDENEGEIWAKLDAGTTDYYHEIERTSIPFERVLDNLKQAAQHRPIVIQSLFLRWRGQAPEAREIEAYCQRLREIVEAGGQIRLVQVYTVARTPAEAEALPLNDAELESLAHIVRLRTGLLVEAYPGG